MFWPALGTGATQGSLLLRLAAACGMKRALSLCLAALPLPSVPDSFEGWHAGKLFKSVFVFNFSPRKTSKAIIMQRHKVSITAVPDCPVCFSLESKKSLFSLCSIPSGYLPGSGAGLQPAHSQDKGCSWDAARPVLGVCLGRILESLCVPCS